MAAATLELPTANELKAFRLKENLGLSDAKIAELLAVRRETANRWRNAAKAKLNKVYLACAEHGCIRDALLATVEIPSIPGLN